MKNFWRILVIFMLPGMVAGGNAVAALFRLADSGNELLINAAMAPLLWCGSFLASSLLTVRNYSPRKIYYYGTLIMAVAFSAGVGLVRLSALPGWYGGVAGVLISGVTMNFFIQGFTSRYFSWRDRWSFIAGGLFAGLIVIYMAGHERLIWLETLFFYLTELLLITWCFASELTVYGAWKKRWSIRIILLTAAAGAFFVSPVLTFLPWNDTPEDFPEGAYQRTFITPQGSCFVWMDKEGNSGIFDASGRLLAQYECDCDLFPAVPGWLGLLKTSPVRIALVVPGRSLLPGKLSGIPGVTVDCRREPTSLNSCFDNGASPLYTHFSAGKKTAPQYYDMLFLDVLPDNPYPGAVRRFWQQNSSGLKESGVVLVRENLLQNQQLTQLLDEQYAFHGVMPGPGNIHVFARQELNLDPAVLEADLIRFYGAKMKILPGVYTLLCQYPETGSGGLQAHRAEVLQCGRNRFWHGAWYWWAACAAGLGVWRLFRVASERRKQRYNYWKSAENGFAAMGTVLLCIGILCMNLGIYSLTAAVLTLPVVLLIGRVRSGGGWVAVAGLIVAAVVFYAGSMWHLLLPVVMIQALLYCGNVQHRPEWSPEQCRKLWIPAAGGMLLAASVMAAMWVWNVPLGTFWVWLAAARLPGIWQNKNMRVY